MIYIQEIARPNTMGETVYKYVYDTYRVLKGLGRMEWESKRTKDEWKELLLDADWGNIKSSPIPLPILINNKIMRNLTKNFGNSFLITASK